MKKRLLSILLVCCMVFSLFPVTVLAADDNIPFEDVKTTDWFYDEVCYAYEKGLMQGTSSTTFDPTGTTSRAMIVTILYRLEGEPALRNANVFSDVVSGSWYEKAVVWANGNGIVTGYGDGKFGPNDPITREQLAAIMYRYADYKEYDVSAKADLAKFTDSSKISSYAVDALAWANAAGLITGTGAKTLDPQGSATRAQAAAILTRFCKEVVPAKEEEKPTGGGSYTPPYNPPTPPTPPAENNLTVSESGTVTGGPYDNVIISASVGNGDVTLDGITITGRLIVEGGGSNSIHLYNCEVNTIEVDKNSTADDAQEPRIELNNTPVEKIEAVQPVIIEADGNSPVAAVEAQSDVTVQGENTTVQNVTAAAENVKLTVKDAAVEKVTAEKPVTIEATSEASTIKEVEAQSDVIVQGAATKVDKVTVPESAADTGVELKIEGAKVAEVAAENPVTINATDGASPIGKVEAKDNLTVKGNAAQIEQVQVPDTATKQPVIDVQAGTVAEVKADKPAEVKSTTGTGAVTNVEANAEVKVASETVTTITVTVQVTVTVTGTSDVEVAVATTNAVSVVTTNTNVSVSTTLNEEINVVTKETESSEGTKVTHVHKWVEDTAQYVAATCTQTGKRVYVCGGVGECDVTERTKTETLPMLPHTEQIVPAKAATCTETGLTAGKKCSVCDTVLVAQQNVPALGHAYATVWSSDNEGHWHECIHCDDRADSAAHTPGAAATETTDQTCTVCGYVITPSTGHQCVSHLTKTAAKAATCTAAGNIEYYTCTCGKFYSNANATTEIAKDSWIIPATGHNYGTPSYEWKAVSGGYTCTATRVCSHNANHTETETVTATYAVTKAATCQAVGSGTYTAVFTSPFTQQTKTVEIAKLLHKEETIPGKAATCEETGLTDGVKCSVCDTVLVAQETVPALGHNWATEWSKDSTQHWHECQREGCDAKGNAANHIPSAAATETTAQTCTVCDYVITPALGHICKNHLTAHEAVDATCTTAGNSAYWSCTCGKYYSDANAENEINENSWNISALGHDLAKTDAKSATCEENGNNAYWTCSRCHKVYADAEGTAETTVAAQTLAATGHNYRAATYEWTAVNGGYTCTGKRVCANNETHVDEATATVTSAVTKGATCTEKGETTYTAKFGGKEGFATQTKTEDIAVLGHNWATAWSKDESYHWHVCQREGCDAVNEKAAHSWNEGEVTTPATGTQDGVKTYTCTVCEAKKTEVIPANYASVSTVEALVTAMNNNDLLGAELAADLTLNGTVGIPAGKTLIVPAGKTLTVTDELYVYGTLDNKGTISNQVLIDVFGGATLTNSGTITGVNPDQTGVYGSSLGIEGGATLTNTGTINDCISVADYFGYQSQNKLCTVNGSFDIASGNFEKMAVVFDAAQIQTLLNDNSYEIVMPCGTDAANENSIELGGITVPAGKILLLKKSVFDGTNTYQNSFKVAAGKTFTQTQGAFVIPAGDPDFVIDGTIAFAALDESGLAQALEDSNVTEIVCSGNLALTRELEIPEGKSVTVNGSLTAAQNCGIDVKAGGSLTVTGSLTLATSSTDYFMEDAGSIEVQKGGSLSIGGVQYIGNGGALTLDSDNASLVLSGIPQDCASQDHPNGIFVLLTGNATVEDNKEFVVTDAWDNFILTNDASLTVNGTLTNNGRIENRGTLNVYGTFNNEGTIDNQNLIDVIGGTLSNSGVINGNWNEDWYDSYIAIENGATINNFIDGKRGTINDRITVADYWRAGQEVKKCQWHVLENDHTFDPVFADGKDNPNFDVMAVGFGTEQVQAALNAVSTWGGNNSAYTYEYVTACGTATESVNTVELGGITVRPMGALMLKDEVFDGTNVYRNRYRISSGKTLTLQEGAALVGVSKDESDKVGLEINGEIVNNGGFVDFGQFTLSGSNKPVIVNNADELAAALAKGGTIYLRPFAQEQKAEIVFEESGEKSYESQYHVSVTAISKNTELIKLGSGDEPVAVFFDNGFTVDSGVTLSIDGLNIVAVKNSAVDGTIEAHNGIVVVQGAEGTTLTISATGKIIVGQPNEWGGLAIFAEGNKIVNNGTIENFGDLNFDRDPRNGQFTGNEPIEYASLRDLVCELNQRFNGYPNMESLNLPDNPNEGPVEDLHWVYDYPDGGSQMFNEANPDDSDYEAIAAFSWLIKNGIIPEYNAETSPELHPFDLVTKAQAAELLNKLGNKIAGTTGQTYSTLSGTDWLSRGELDPAANELEVAVRKAGGENIVQNAAELTAALANGGKIYLLPFAQEDRTEVTFEETDEKSYESQYHLTGAYTISTDTELIKLGGENEPIAVFFDDGFTVNSGKTLKIDGLNIVAAADSTVSGKIEVRNGQVVVQGATGAKLTNNGEIFVDGSGALAIYQSGNKIVNYGGIDVLGELIAPMGHNWDDVDGNDQRIYVVENEGSYINFFPDVMEFGKRLLERVEAYGLTTMSDDERAANFERAADWPDDETDDARRNGFEFLVKNGGVEPVSEGNRNVWRPYDKITYGQAIDILTNVYKAIDNDATDLPPSVALGNNGWTPNDNDCISDNDVNDLLEKFVEALPPVEAKDFAFTIERKNCQPSEGVCDGGWHELVNGSHDNTIRNLHFTEAVTISNATTGLTENDTWGGKIRFEGCVFDCDINVTYNPTCDFRVEFDESCEFKNGAKVDVKQAQDADSKDLLANRNVTVYFGCTGGKVVSSARARAEAADDVSFLFNGVTVSGTNAENGGFGACMNFNCDAEHDDSFSWDANDHSDCSGDIVPEYQFTTDGDAEMTVTGTTAEKYPIRLSGIVDISGLVALENQEITLHYWSKCRDDNGNETGSHNTDVKIGGHSVSINDSGDYVVSGTGTVTVHNQDENTRITVNGKELGNPHVFGNGGGIYLGLTDTDGVSFALEQGNTVLDFNAVLYNENGPVTELNPTATKLQLEKKDDNNWITDPNDVRLTVTVNVLSIVYDPLRNKVENDNENQ